MSGYTYRRGSIFWALTLIAVGAIFLWQNFNPSIHPWQLIAKFWPIIIIFWGLSKLIDYVQAHAHPDTVPPPLFSGSEVVMLILILVLGTIISKMILRPWQPGGWNIDGEEIASLFLNSYTYTKTFSQPVQGKPHLVLDDLRGDVQIQGTDSSSIDVMAKTTIRADDDNAAKRIFDNLKLEVVEEGGHYVLRTNRRSLPDDGRRVTVDMNLRVPRGTTCDVSSGRGDITVSGLNGDQTLYTSRGDVRASNIQGLVKIRKSGGSSEVHDVKGSVEVTGRGGDIEVANVSDTVTVHGEFGGAVQFRNVGQTLRFQSLRTDMTAQKLTGRLYMEVGSLEANGIDGPFDITTRQKDITLRDFKHSVHITDNNGQISLQASTPPVHDIQVDSKNGAVDLTLPAGASFQIEADSRHGAVECDFSGPGLKITKGGDTPSIAGSHGKGGPMIRINTDYGAIRILRGNIHPSAAPATPSNAQTTRNHLHRQAPVAALSLTSMLQAWRAGIPSGRILFNPLWRIRQSECWRHPWQSEMLCKAAGKAAQRRAARACDGRS